MRATTYERHVTSGDLIADRRYEFARDLAARGDLGGARDLLAQALELAPGFAAAWFALGEIKNKAGDKDGAVAAFRAACDADPQDRLPAAGFGDGAMPAGYVRALFDQYAPDFDRALGEGLSYRAPALLLAAIAAACKDCGRAMRFGAMLDLGCGTGLAGAAFRPHVDWLTGVDLSSGMIAQARAKGLYDRLIVDDIMQFPRGRGGGASAASPRRRRRRLYLFLRPRAYRRCNCARAGAGRIFRFHHRDPNRNR